MSNLNFRIVRFSATETVKRFNRQYPAGRSFKLADGRDAGDISKALLDLKNPTQADIEKIIGDDNWSTILCSCCRTCKPEAVSFGNDFHIDGWLLCEDCLRAALNALCTPKTQQAGIDVMIDEPQKDIAQVVRNAALDTLKESAPGISESMRLAIANSIAIKVRKTFA